MSSVDKLFGIVASPVGDLLLTSNGEALTGLYPGTHRELPDTSTLVRDDAHFTGVRDQLSAWFRGKLFDFTVALAPRGTAFQVAVWKQLALIPWGTTWTYAQLAQSVGRPSASRAVGAAVGKNPISFIIPCHRIIGASGALTGYAGGLVLKKYLLDHENQLCPPGLIYGVETRAAR